MRGRNPCLICTTPTDGPKGGVVCDRCRQKVADYDVALAEFKAGTVTVRMDRHQWVAYFGRESMKVSDELSQVLKSLLAGLRAPATGAYGFARPDERHADAINETIRGSHEGSPYLAPVSLGLPLTRLRGCINAAITAAYTSGKADGADLLAQLAAGELTTAEFEEKAGITPRKRT